MSNQWPENMSYKSFCQLAKQKPVQLYSELFLQHKNQFSVRNQQIAVKKLQKIFEATFKLANESGFQAMSLRILSSKTGMSMGGLYAYIQSKDDLAQLIHSFLKTYCEDKIHQLVKEELPADQRLVALIHTHIYLSELMQPWFYFAYMETKNLSKQQKTIAIQSELTMENKIFEAIEDGVKDGYFHSVDDIQLLASLIKSMLQDWYLKHGKYKKRKITVDNYAKTVVDFSLKYLQFGMPT